jgi:sugar phosphate isomerase/epimerase
MPKPLTLTRRQFHRALAVVPFASALAFAQGNKPNSTWAGVRVGMNVPYNFGTGNYTPADEILAKCLQLGVSAIELRSQPVELFLGGPGQGAPAADLNRWRTEASTHLADFGAWRASSNGTAADFLRTYSDAGVTIEIVKFDGILNFTDEVLDYAFTLAKTLRARAISCELPVNRVEAAQRLGQFAEKHQMMIGFHGHTQMTPAIWEQAFTYSRFNGANLDIGHFVGGNKTSPIPFLEKHHDRITHLHVKDKTLQDKNVPFGEGDTPIKEALQLIRDRRWNIQATIEFEYPVPAGSDRMTELAKCVDYCRRCLLG